MGIVTRKTLLGAAAGLALATSANAATVDVNADITVSTTWTANNTYRLKKQIFVKPGATLTIEAGTLVQSLPADQGSLAVTRGAKIFVNGTKDKPVIFTSTNDDLVTPRVANSEWGNLTIMGRGYVSKSTRVGNTATPTGLNIAQMEGLSNIPDDTNPDVLYGGNDDNDDSGRVAYASFRYGGKVVGFANELNGLSLGAIGRNTDIHHIDIWCNVDDGIEIWGGAVGIKHFQVWNIGDDSVDIDQGYRGKMQFGLIVQGHSGLVANQGGGIGDNLFEMDGAENSDAQPLTTVVFENITTIGQPNSATGDHGTAWRDGARAQFHRCIWMDLGDNLVNNDNIDGDGGSGYGHNGTLTFAEIWTSAYTEAHNTGNAKTGGHPNAGGLTMAQLQTLYPAQVSGNLAEIRDSVFFNNVNSAYSESDARGVTLGGASNPAVNNVVAAASPITSITRGADVPIGAFTLKPVTSLNPLAANDAVTSAETANADGFFSKADFRGGFKNVNWGAGWSTASKYGILTGGAVADPTITQEVKLTTLTFQTTAGVLYNIESSNDGKAWTFEQQVAGDGTLKTVSVVLGAGFNPNKIYRVVPL